MDTGDGASRLYGASGVVGIIVVEKELSREQLLGLIGIIQTYPSIRMFYLNDSGITDEHLTLMNGLTQLLLLDVSNTKVSASAVSALQAKLPGTAIRL